MAFLWFATMAAAPLISFVADAAEVDTEYIYGFTEGTELGRAGDVDYHVETRGRVGTSSGRYGVLSTDGVALFSLTDDFRIAPAFTIDSFSVHEVPGVEGRSTTSFEGPSIELKYRVLDYKTQPFGLTFGATPYYARVDALTGTPVRERGATLLASLDQPLIPERLYGALNVVYGLSRTDDALAGTRADESSLTLSGALSAQVLPSLLIGGEVRYIRSYDGLGLDRSVGSALYIGPTFYVRLADATFVSGGLNVRATGRDTNSAAAGRSDGAEILNGLQRCQFVLRYGQRF